MCPVEGSGDEGVKVTDSVSSVRKLLGGTSHNPDSHNPFFLVGLQWKSPRQQNILSAPMIKTTLKVHTQLVSQEAGWILFCLSNSAYPYLIQCWKHHCVYKRLQICFIM